MSGCLLEKLRQIIKTLKDFSRFLRKLWRLDWRANVYFDETKGEFQNVDELPIVTLQIKKSFPKNYKVQKYGGSDLMCIPKECKAFIVKDDYVTATFHNVIFPQSSDTGILIRRHNGGES